MLRLDVELVNRELATSRTRAQRLIEQGFVSVDGEIITKASTKVNGSEEITVSGDAPHYVSRGAYKLLGALEAFQPQGLASPQGRECLDIGASTGGFTDFALKNGAKKVYAIDVGKGELAQPLRQDGRVVVLEGRDFRTVGKDLCKGVNMVIGDLSFISLRHILPKVVELFGKDIEICMLFKPQFECGMAIAKKCKGVVKDRSIHKRLLKDFCGYVLGLGLKISALTFSPIKGKSGNIEYLFHINGKSISFDIEKVVEEAFVNAKKEV